MVETMGLVIGVLSIVGGFVLVVVNLKKDFFLSIEELKDELSEKFSMSLRAHNSAQEVQRRNEITQLNQSIHQRMSESEFVGARIFVTEQARGVERLHAELRKWYEGVGRESRASRGELNDALARQSQGISDAIETMHHRTQEQIALLDASQQKMVRETSEALATIRHEVEEKLQKGLEARLGRSFKAIHQQLHALQHGLGEVSNLAGGIGDLKRIFTNVKTRGIVGEVQLERLLDEVFTREQYASNIATRPNSSMRVEVAIALPGGSDEESAQPLWLPIDAKFPTEAYGRLQDAQELADLDGARRARNELRNTILKCGKTIREKYVEPPYTTDFAILFLPIESLFAEVNAIPGIVETLQREHQIMLAGPSTLLALLHSLQMGFRTLAIQERSAEVWRLLGQVKLEFNRFGQALAKAQKKIRAADNELEQLVTTRTRAVLKRLENVQNFEATRDSQGRPVGTASPLSERNNAEHESTLEFEPISQMNSAPLAH